MPSKFNKKESNVIKLQLKCKTDQKINFKIAIFF